MKRHYEKPAMRVVALQQRHHLLQGSRGIKGEISGYSKSGSGFSQNDKEPDNENDNMYEW